VFSPLSNIRKRLRASLLWSSALTAASKSQYAVALQKIEAIEQIGEWKGSLKIEKDLLKGFLNYALDNYKLSYEILWATYYQIENEKYFSDQEKIYLKCYAAVWASSSAIKGGRTRDDGFECDLSQISLEKSKKTSEATIPVARPPRMD
jgi:hypothetical protein